MRMLQGTTDQYVYFVAVDSTDLKTRETGLTTFTVYYSINGGTATAMTTPTVNETDTTNMPGVYELLIDESGMTTLAAGDDTSELCLHITQADMAPVTRVIEIYREETTAGNTLDVTATGAAGIDWGNVENPGTTVDLSATDINLCDTVTTNSDMRGTDNAALASVLGALADAAATGDPTAADTVMQYVKQLVNLLAGSDGIATMPAGANPANNINLFEMVRGLAGSTFDTATDSLEQLQADVAGVQSDTDDIQTRLPAALVGGAMDCDVSNIQNNAITAAAIATDAIDADAIASDAVTELRSILSGTADAGGTTTTLVDAALTEIDDTWNGNWLLITSGTDANRCRLITDFDAASDTITFAPAVSASIGAGVTYEILPAGAVDVQSWIATESAHQAPNALVSGRVDSDVGNMQADTVDATAIATGAIDADAIASDAITAAKVADGTIDAATFAAGAIDATAIATDAIDADAIAANAIGSSELATDAIGSDQIAADAIGASEIAANAITSSELADSAAQKIRDEILPTQNATFNNIMFLFVDSTDHVTPVTGATGTAVTRSIDGGSFASGTGTLAEVSNGIYQYDASAADMNGGIITFRFTATGGTPNAPDDRFVTVVTGGGV